ncbi:hypothetical protein DR193_06355 [Lawsonia intracellularis]|uniref:hypothetical protein n=1 Tax=Lawsonia intracellularis TaxID=29546 RepID=UPI000DE347C9|nr:hypothetical protein [Lawsonia intracellularis]RBN34727.1 hypothetical protein DR193_06355 [Lawsonia intracellularis]
MISLNNSSIQIPQQNIEESTSQEVTSSSGGQPAKVDGVSIQAPKAPVTSAASNLEGVQQREAQENVTKMGLPELSAPKGGGYVQSTAAMFAEVTVDAMNQQRKAAQDVQNSALEGMVNKMLEAAKDIKEQSKLMMGLGIASSVMTTAMGFGGTIGGVKSMTAKPGVGTTPQAQVTSNKLTLGKEIAEGIRGGMDTGKESQVKSIDADIRTTQAEEKKLEAQMELVKQFAENSKNLAQQALQIMSEVTRDANATTQRILA